jgi:hypothetical protein
MDSKMDSMDSTASDAEMRAAIAKVIDIVGLKEAWRRGSAR